MSMTKLKLVTGVLLALSLLLSVSSPPALAQPSPAQVNLAADTFAQLHKQIKPQPYKKADDASAIAVTRRRRIIEQIDRAWRCRQMIHTAAVFF